MKKKIIISAIVAYCIGYLLSPPDMMSQLTNGLLAALLCTIPLLILAGRGFVKTASTSVHTLICVLVCMVAVLAFACYMLTLVVSSRTGDPGIVPEVTSHL